MATTDISNFDEEPKINYKRRSSIFYTRIIMCDQDEDNKTIANENDIPSKEEECNMKKEVLMKEYIEKLTQEKKDWQQEYKNRKSQCRNLIKQKTSMETQGQALDLNLLTESDRAFLLERPNYEYICRNNQKLLDMTLKISVLSEIVHKFNLKFMEKMQDNMSKAIKNLIKMSEQ
ncbi:uncharacterized protein [Linepithema humile]|uniref:uncharacterized protein n=1 Tax=Linepithema humile TaxID=83485 RepID=UPI0006236046|nr:PREDICTED: uncharacterized protein LOC105675715 [Linepithema humile]